jgi:hypothetical protein
MRLSLQPEDNPMMESTTKAPANFGQRCHRLNAAAHGVRQQAIRNGCDLAGWRLSRLMRDANTDAEIHLGEQEYGVWIRFNRSQEPTRLPEPVRPPIPPRVPNPARQPLPPRSK